MTDTTLPDAVHAERVAARLRFVKPSFVREVLKAASDPNLISFAGGLPAPELFDVEGLREAVLMALGEDAKASLQYGVTEGQPVLRTELSKIMAGRGAPAELSRIVVTTGSQQGIDLLARTLLDPGDVVLLERPTYLAALQVFELAEARLVGVEGDEGGLDPDDLERKIEAVKAAGKRAKLLYVVSTFANPSGATLSRERRLRLLEIAAKHDLLVIEDDPYCELRFSGQAEVPLVGLAHEVPGAEHLVAYLSSLSKVVSPGLRVGWMVLPEWLLPKVVIVKQASDLHASTLSQQTAARYLQSGRLPGHIVKIREAYQARAGVMMAALRRVFPQNVLDFGEPEGGMFLWGRMSEGVDTMALVTKAMQAGVIFVPGVSFFPDTPRGNTLRLSFTTTTPEQIEEGVRRLASVTLD